MRNDNPLRCADSTRCLTCISLQYCRVWANYNYQGTFQRVWTDGPDHNIQLDCCFAAWRPAMALLKGWTVIVPGLCDFHHQGKGSLLGQHSRFASNRFTLLPGCAGGNHIIRIAGGPGIQSYACSAFCAHTNRLYDVRDWILLRGIRRDCQWYFYSMNNDLLFARCQHRETKKSKIQTYSAQRSCAGG